MGTADYVPIVDAGAEGLVVYQETYNRAVYAEMHPAGPKRDFNFRLDCAERGYRAATEQRPQGTLTVLSPPDAKSGAPRAFFVAKGFYGAANSKAAAEAILNVTFEKSLAVQPEFKDLAPADTNAGPASAAE